MSSAISLEDLNDHQRQAVTAPVGHYLILAGAGSGKTRVLVHRIAHLMSHEQSSPFAILSVTFTNKAAQEMRERIAQISEIPIYGMWVGTFHGISHRILRAHFDQAGINENFQIIDSDDQLRLVKRVMQSLGIDEKRFAPKQAQWFINQQKEKGFRAAYVPNQNDFFTRTKTQIYAAYEKLCQQSDLIDFGELILRTVELLENNASVADHYQQRFAHILVDEFQDTNSIQYRWLRAFSRGGASMMAVGDDDQSIYSWRGAKIENINHFEADYSNVKVIRLEQNYRSTQTILQAANAVIAHNHNRLGKELWTEGDSGSKIKVYEAFNEHDEAYFISQQVRLAIRQGYQHQDIAVLYRSNAQSRVLEEVMIREQIPYRIYGGQKFFDRAEIKDAIAYCRVVANTNDDAALDRIINMPPRGIGQQTVAKLRELASERGVTLYEAIRFAIEEAIFASRATRALGMFSELIDHLVGEKQTLSLDELVERCIKHSGLLQHFQKDKSEKGISRVDNLEELVSAMGQFDRDVSMVDESVSDLDAYLAHIALETGDAREEVGNDCINLMTMHAAKGLEFAYVCICGVEEGLFPHKMSMDSPGGLEEERRLCYVGMTRAKNHLVMSYATWRRMYANEKRRASRFIHEIPKALLDMPKSSNTHRQTPQANEFRDNDFDDMGDGLAIGQCVEHSRFGIGTIVQCEGSGASARIAIEFEGEGLKWLVAKYARLTVIGA